MRTLGLLLLVPAVPSGCFGLESDDGPTGVLHGVTFQWRERSDLLDVTGNTESANWGPFVFSAKHASVRMNLNGPASNTAGVAIADGQETSAGKLSTAPVDVGHRLYFCRTAGDKTVLIGMSYGAQERSGGTWFNTMHMC